MRPIGQISAIHPSSVLYHSAFGFARVTAVDPERVTLQWESGTENLPTRVTHDVLVRIYAVCDDGGFFHRAAHDPQGLKEMLATAPADALSLLLADLNGPQRAADIREWVAGRRLLTSAGFTQWWKSVLGVCRTDDRFAWDGDAVCLRSPDASLDPAGRLANPLLPPGRRLDLAIDLRGQLTEAQFVEHVLLAYRTGGTQVRELALAAVRDRPPDEVFVGLLSAGTDAIESLIHAIRRGGWNAEQLSTTTHQALVDLLLRGTSEGGPLDGEGRLAAALCRWNAPGVESLLSAISSTTDGKRLLRGTFTALPQRRGEALALTLLREALAAQDDATARWIGSELLGLALVDPATLADRIDSEWPELADWFRHDFTGVEAQFGSTEDDSFDETAHTAEIDLSGLVEGPVALANLPPRSGASLLGLGLAMARALSVHHKDHVIVNPTAQTTRILPDETMEVDPQPDGPDGYRPEGEPPSLPADVYMAGVLLVEALLGRRWPTDVPTHRALPYLRAAIQHLAPSVLAPLDMALHPDPSLRPQDGLSWLAVWQHAAVAEENRGYAAPDPTARLQVGYDSHIGRSKILLGQTNQDAIWVSTRGPLSLITVCDGISTANAGSGDVASSIATHVLANLWDQALPRLSTGRTAEIRDFLDRALRTANTAVCDAALRIAGGNLDGRVPMGTTVVTAVLHGNQVHLAWLGDSRAYLLGPYGASLLTADENQACERLKAWHMGYIESWEAAGFALVGYLGHFNELSRAEALPAHHASFTLLPGERLMLMSDGITDYLGEHHPEVAHVLAAVGRQDDPDETSRALVGLANRAGGGDNCTIIIASLW